MRFVYDVLIVGAGPAGMGCAITLQKRGRSVCVIDKAKFPRNKTCAGLITKKSYKLINLMFDGNIPEDLFSDTSRKIRLYRKNELISDSDLKEDVRLVDRIVFDNALVERYRSLGGIIKDGESNFRLAYKENRASLSNGDVIEYKYLVFADGTLSLSHQLIPLDKSRLAFGVEVYLDSGIYDTNSIDLYFGYMKDGYIWVFPHNDRVCVGCADSYRADKDYKKILNGFLNDIGVDTKSTKLKYEGAFLSYGYVVEQNRLPDNIMLIGDAGGFVDPITGEGIYMALESGRTLANSLLTTDPKKVFLKKMDPLIRNIGDGRKLRKMFYSPMQKKMFDKKKGKSRPVSFFFENVVEEYRFMYNDTGKILSAYKASKGKDQ